MAIGVKLVSDEEASPEVKQMFEQIKQQTGMVPPTIRAMANKPDYLKLYLEKMQLVMGPGKLDGKTKVLLALAAKSCEAPFSTASGYVHLLGITSVLQ